MEIDAQLAEMMAVRRASFSHERPASKTVHLWCFGRDQESALHIAHTPADFTGDTERSAIWEMTAQLSARIRSRAWGFGLAFCAMGELLHDAKSIPDDLLREVNTDRLRVRPLADLLCAATIFDARGRKFCSAGYIHASERGPTSWQNDTLDGQQTIDTWLSHLRADIVTAQVWAAAVSLSPDQNLAVVRGIRAIASKGRSTAMTRPSGREPAQIMTASR
ncbi:hypothetical protein [Nocardia suismassiliense]|uniref:hypothetical protein n=1 Tax=Nocardia suismassiliense TaxID=2077092 RepID=UPI000D1E71DC|nr:hypothetical protein [Nocardia suismassiliense]